MLSDRIERYHQGLKNAEARLARCQAQNDQLGIDYNKRSIAKYKKLLSEPLRPLPPSIPFGRWP